MDKHTSEVVITPQYVVGCGLDIHKNTIVSYISNKDGSHCDLKEWPTFTEDLESLRDYLVNEKVEVVLMESTGIYWISLYHLLKDAGLNVVVSNPQHIKQIPKRKTDRKDAKWLCTLAMNGLVRKSFIPDSVQHEYRELCRMREQYRKNITRYSNRIVKVLERNNIKLRSVSSNIRTKTCQSIIAAIVSGVTQEDQLIELVCGRLKSKTEEIRKAIRGTITQSEKELIQMINEDRLHCEKQVLKIEEKLAKLDMEHYKFDLELLDQISGIGKISAQQIIAEIGTDMSKFERADQLTSWAGLAPGNNESAGKTKNTSTKKGNKHLRTTMVTIAWGAVRTKKSYWSFLYAYLKRKMPSTKAIIVIARKMLKLVFKTLVEKSTYVEGGKTLFDYHQNNRHAIVLNQNKIAV